MGPEDRGEREIRKCESRSANWNTLESKSFERGVLNASFMFSLSSTILSSSSPSGFLFPFPFPLPGLVKIHRLDGRDRETQLVFTKAMKLKRCECAGFR